MKDSIQFNSIQYYPARRKPLAPAAEKGPAKNAGTPKPLRGELLFATFVGCLFLWLAGIFSGWLTILTLVGVAWVAGLGERPQDKLTARESRFWLFNE